MKKRFTESFAGILILFSAVFVMGFFFVEWLAQTGALAAYARSIAAQTSALCSLFHIPHALDGLVITTQARQLIIVAECTAIFLMITYVALVVAYPFSLAIKALALLGGLIFIYLLNLARLVLTVALSDHVSDATFNFMHNIFFQGFMVMILLVMWAMLLSFDKTGHLPSGALSFFCFVVLALFVFEGAVVWLDWLDPAMFPLSEMVYLPPALAVIACARGRSVARRLLLFAGTCFIFVGGVQVQAFVSDQLRTGALQQTTLNVWLVEIVYGICVIGIPILSIVIAAGSKPQRLWQKAPR